MALSGTVKSFNATKGFGFIAYEDTDVFCHLRDCASGVPLTGDTVTFDMEESPKKPGCYVAKNIKGGTGSLPAKGGGKGSAGTGAFFGQCKSYSQLKAFGFINHDGTEIFFHMKDIADGSCPRMGDQLQFDLEDNPGKPGSHKAANVSGGTDFPEDFKGGKGGKGKGGKGKGQDGFGAWGKGGGDSWGPYGGGDAWGKGGCNPWGKGADSWGKGGGCWGKGGDAWGKGWGGW